MKIRKLFVALLISTTTVFSFAQNNSFSKEMSAWHKKAVITCGMIKSPDAGSKSQVIDQNLNELSEGLGTITQKYLNNPPAEYKNDPLWTSYFDDLADNLTVVKYYANKQEYRVAGKNCSVFCQTILRMHKNNGTVELSDMLFSLNMQLKLTTDISNAGNTEGAKDNVELVKKIIEHAAKKVKSDNNANLQALFVPVVKTTQDWLKAIEAGDAKAAKTLYTSFTPDFQKIFMASME
ncbi:MAG: hypothetical protein ACPLXM_00720 [Bacteroidales bacterium]